MGAVQRTVHMGESAYGRTLPLLGGPVLIQGETWTVFAIDGGVARCEGPVPNVTLSLSLASAWAARDAHDRQQTS